CSKLADNRASRHIISRLCRDRKVARVTARLPMTAGSGRSTISEGRQILLVDDDEVFREATARLLRSAGYKVQLAPDFRLALQILESNEPIDLLILDIVMP